MSDNIASHITATLSQFDDIVRNGLRDGDIFMKWQEHYPQIVSVQASISFFNDF